jgi:hypothetical protein
MIRKVRVRIKESWDTATTTDQEHMFAELAEIEQLEAAIARQSKPDKEAQVREIKSSPGYKEYEKRMTDPRRPTRANISGLWMSGFNVIQVMQLEQHGSIVTGRGFTDGCIGISCVFETIGTYENGVLSLTYEYSHGETSQEVFRHFLGRPYAPGSSSSAFVRDGKFPVRFETAVDRRRGD